MQFSSLEKLSISELTDLFNQSFADYFVKINLTPEILQEKIQTEDVQLDKSVGIFTEGKPVGFILHAIRTINGQKIAYNAGTGVIPEFRGKNATVKMYKHILPVLWENGVKKVVLEVMEQNAAAIKSYLNSGFKKTKNLECFNGIVKTTTNSNQNISFKKTDNKEILKLSHFGDWEPTWQHSTETVKQSSSYETFCANLNDILVAYVTVVPKTGRVAQFAVNTEYRKTGVGTSMFKYLSEICPNGISLINVDGDNIETLHFLKKIGLNHFLRQLKMELTLNSK